MYNDYKNIKLTHKHCRIQGPFSQNFVNDAFAVKLQVELKSNKYNALKKTVQHDLRNYSVRNISNVVFYNNGISR